MLETDHDNYFHIFSSSLFIHTRYPFHVVMKMSLNKKHTQSKQQNTYRNKQNTVDLGVKMQDVPILTFLQYVLYVWTWGALLQRGCQSLMMSYVHGESSARDSVFTEGRREAAPACHSPWHILHRATSSGCARPGRYN